MASASHIKISTDRRGVIHAERSTQSAAEMTSKCLQENHDSHHIFFNHDGFHNHIAHHLLTLYALGATAEQIANHYEKNKSYQRPMGASHLPDERQFQDSKVFKDSLGEESLYPAFLKFFQGEIDQKGYPAIVNEYILGNSDVAQALFVRMFAGFLHPLIHLGFGVEFDQPAIVAEALAQAAVHSGWIGDALIPADNASQNLEGVKSLVTLLDEIRRDEKLSTAAHWSDGNKIRDGLLVNAPTALVTYLSQWKVQPGDLGARTAEMINAAAYFTGAAQRPPHIVKFDFYYMHCLNCSMFFTSFLEQPWISIPDKVRLLEWKGRLDLAMYASRRSPALLMDEITDYVPQQPGGTWASIFERVNKHEDDGHAAKLIRALANGERACKAETTNQSRRIEPSMFLQLAHMAIDSVDHVNPRWVRSAGFDEAWKDIPERPRAQL